MPEVRRVSRGLEANRMLSMSCTPRLLRELVETLRIIDDEIDCESDFDLVHKSNQMITIFFLVVWQSENRSPYVMTFATKLEIVGSSVATPSCYQLHFQAQLNEG